MLQLDVGLWLPAQGDHFVSVLERTQEMKSGYSTETRSIVCLDLLTAAANRIARTRSALCSNSKRLRQIGTPSTVGTLLCFHTNLVLTSPHGTVARLASGRLQEAVASLLDYLSPIQTALIPRETMAALRVPHSVRSVPGDIHSDRTRLVGLVWGSRKPSLTSA